MRVVLVCSCVYSLENQPLLDLKVAFETKNIFEAGFIVVDFDGDFVLAVQWTINLAY